MYGNQQLVPGLAPVAEVRFQRTSHRRSPVRRSAIWATSLSPRPESVTRHRGARRHRAPGLPCEPTDRVRRFERRHDPLGDREELEPRDGFVVGGERVLGPACRRELGVLRTDTRIVEAGADRVRLEDLAVFVLEEQRPRTRGARRARRGSPMRRADRTPSRTHPLPRPPAAAEVSRKPANVPIAFEPPPTHATTRSGSVPRIARHCSRASSPTTRWNSRTIHGYGCGPTTDPMQ